MVRRPRSALLAPLPSLRFVAARVRAFADALLVILALDLPETPEHVEGTRARLKHLVSPRFRDETEPGLFQRPGTPLQVRAGARAKRTSVVGQRGSAPCAPHEVSPAHKPPTHQPGTYDPSPNSLLTRQAKARSTARPVPHPHPPPATKVPGLLSTE
jgi:hypothetical protein